MRPNRDRWTITVESPGDRQTLAAIVAECRCRLAGELPAAMIGSVCQTVWSLGEAGRPVRIDIDADHAEATPLVGHVSPSLSVTGLGSGMPLAIAS